MTQAIHNIKLTRTSLLNIIDGLTVEQLNKIPEGFNNNIIWNVAHLISAQQGICYVRAGLKYPVEEHIFKAYAVGTKPEAFVDDIEIAKIKELLLSTLDILAADFDQNIFFGYQEWTTRYGVMLSNIDEALKFLIFHEGLHFGYIMALKRVIA